MKRGIWLIYALILAIFLGSALWAGFYFTLYPAPSNNADVPGADTAVENADVPVYSSGIYSKDFFDTAYDRAQEVGPVAHVTSAVVAHHLLVAPEIAKVFETIGNNRTKTVVLLSPNHFSVGRSALQVSQGTWSTPYGEVQSDLDAVQQLLNVDAVLKNEEAAFPGEHGIGVITPFVKRSFPNAKIVSILFSDTLSAEDADRLGEEIAHTLPDAVVVASVDMSHYLPQLAQEYHDAVTENALAAGSSETSLEVDSKSVLRTLFTYNASTGNQLWQETYHDSSLQTGATENWRENTSHILGYFLPGNPTQREATSMQFVGDIMLDRGVRKQIDAAGTVAYPWEEVSRFLSGSGLTVGNLEGTVNEQASTYTYDPPFRFVFSPESVEEATKYIDVVSLANNHTRDVGYAGEMETRSWLDGMNEPWFGAWAEPVPRIDTEVNGRAISLIGYHAFQPNEAELLNQITEAKDAGRFVIVMPHWGVEYQTNPSTEQRRLAKAMVAAGADLIIGSHPHVVEGAEVIGNTPVIYSLGNFVFDQEIPATWNAVSVGVILQDDSVTIHFMPIYTRYGQPTPLGDNEAQAVLNTIASASPEELQSSILQGSLTVSYE